jgi:hypothetical protein
MKTAHNFRDYYYDASQNVFLAKVDIHGVRGLYRTPHVRAEIIERNATSNVWRLRRNGQPLLEVKALEDAYNQNMERA